MDHVCPLCCEELDISDREFYPCKCGYQVCMWCWHRIRESESGLCPACRTPYGEDPHQFSAVDVEEVLKANKVKEAAAKRERERLRHQSGGSGGGSGDLSAVLSHMDGEGSMRTGAIAIPNDRSQLANMRVIRRNLVYAVGLPPDIATEDKLRKPDCFGQYGKISKIVLNRTQATAPDPRRASASAYVTFVHKEDTLSCILALDGFYLENRNIRASYGTSKYCSAFIKNVRCNNPDCTYLHEMGAPEDTFTKQEIQAGYVTSGRDVLARQQEIVAEQLRLGGSGGGAPRKRTGHGGPSGTGRVASNPVFPEPEYDVPSKPSTLVPPLARVNRSHTVTGTNMAPTVSAVAKLTRSTSASSKSPTLAPLSAPGIGVHGAKRASSVGATAASVVAGVHTVAAKPPEVPDPHTTLTPLTPLKRPTKGGRTSTAFIAPAPAEDAAAMEKLAPLRNGNGKKSNSARIGGAGVYAMENVDSVSSIGGDIIGPPLKVGTNMMGDLGGDPVATGVDTLGGRPISMDGVGGGARSSALGGELYTGEIPHSSKNAIGGGSNDMWNAGAIGGNTLSTGAMLGGNADNSGASGLWGANHNNPSASLQGLNPGPVGGGVIGSHISSSGSGGGNSSSALASLLGINLPSGSGSLQESPNLWSTGQQQSSLSTLNSTSVPSQGVIGGSSMNSTGGSSLIGGVTIGGGGSSSVAPPHQPGGAGGSNNSDIALLQSLLPGVHITSGNESIGFGGQGWNGAAPASSPLNQQSLGSSSLSGDSAGGNTWTSNMAAAPVGSAGAIGQNVASPNRRQQGPGIW